MRATESHRKLGRMRTIEWRGTELSINIDGSIVIREGYDDAAGRYRHPMILTEQRHKKNNHKMVGFRPQDGSAQTCTPSIAQLVALAYHGECPEGSYHIGFKDGNYNNTHKDNVHYVYMGQENARKTLCCETGVVYDSARQAAIDFNVNDGHINNVIHGKRKSVSGYTFKYVDAA